MVVKVLNRKSHESASLTFVQCIKYILVYISTLIFWFTSIDIKIDPVSYRGQTHV